MSETLTVHNKNFELQIANEMAVCCRSAWVEELWGGALSEGVSAESLGHTGLPSIHPAVAHLKGLYVLPKLPTGDGAAFELLGGLASTDTHAAITQEWYRIRAAAATIK